MKDKIIMIFRNSITGTEMDIEVPKTITANELVIGLNQGLCLGIDINDSRQCFLCAKNPRALIKGNKTLEEFGLRDGSMVILQRNMRM